MTERFRRDVLLPVLRHGMDAGPAPAVLTGEDMARLRQFGARQALLPVIWRGLEGQAAAPEELRRIRNENDRTLYQFMQRGEAVRRITAALDGASIPYIPLKGAVLQALYPRPWMRTSCDVDILVPEAELDRAAAVIAAEAGFTAGERNYHDVAMTNGAVVLELHFSLRENMDRIDGLLSQVWSHAAPAGEGSRHVLTPEFQIFHVLAHMSYHMVHGGLGVRPFLDLWLLRTKTAYDEAAVRRMCGACGLLRFYDVCCELIRAWMEGAEPSGIMAELEEYCLRGGVFGSARNASAAGQREYRGAGYILRRIFVRREVLREMYPGLKKRPWLWGFYQIKRWTRLWNKGKRRQSMRELRRTKNADAAEIARFDRLLTGVGL